MNLSATPGFLYTGDLLHENLQHTQYIAPLHADFNPSHTDTGRILIMSTGEREVGVVIYKQVYLLVTATM